MLTKSPPVLGFGIIVALSLVGCAKNPTPTSSPATTVLNQAPQAQNQPDPPSGLVTVSVGGQSLEIWPFTAEDFGTPSDPINLIFVNAHATDIRAALFALDGNRPGLPIPPIYPFNSTWSDAQGGVQTAYSENGGWMGSVIQLQLGVYGPIRFHLRLFETRGEPGSVPVTLAGVHFEILIPGTADHQVMSWELAEQIATYDIARTGLLAAAPGSTGVIGPTPGFRTIPPAIYNGVPDGLKQLCGLPTGPSAVPVPIPTNGAATVLTLGNVPAAPDGNASQNFTVTYHQIIPRPFCSDGPLDYLLVDGPVEISKDVRVSDGRYEYNSSIRGRLTAVPVDVTKSPPQPAGEPFDVQASDMQFGFLTGHDARVSMQANRLVHEDGAEKQFISLVVHELGTDRYTKATQCLSE